MIDARNYNDNSILIKTGSIFSVFKDPKMVINVRKVSTTMNEKSNGG